MKKLTFWNRSNIEIERQSWTWKTFGSRLIRNFGRLREGEREKDGIQSIPKSILSLDGEEMWETRDRNKEKEGVIVWENFGLFSLDQTL